MKLIDSWKAALGTRSFAIQLSVALVVLFVLGLTIDEFFAYVQSVEGKKLHDPILALISPEDMSVLIFTLIYSALAVGLVSFLHYPRLLLTAIEAYVLITLARMITLHLFPLEPDENMIPLIDPFVDRFFYNDQAVTKDLFFSGHVSVLVMLALVSDNFYLKRLFATVALIVGVSLLIQHAHYTIDVAAAPVFAWIGTAVAKKLVSRTLPN